MFRFKRKRPREPAALTSSKLPASVSHGDETQQGPPCPACGKPIDLPARGLCVECETVGCQLLQQELKNCDEAMRKKVEEKPWEPLAVSTATALHLAGLPTSRLPTRHPSLVPAWSQYGRCEACGGSKQGESGLLCSNCKGPQQESAYFSWPEEGELLIPNRISCADVQCPKCKRECRIALGSKGAGYECPCGQWAAQIDENGNTVMEFESQAIGSWSTPRLPGETDEELRSRLKSGRFKSEPNLQNISPKNSEDWSGIDRSTSPVRFTVPSAPPQRKSPPRRRGTFWGSPGEVAEDHLKEKINYSPEDRKSAEGPIHMGKIRFPVVQEDEDVRYERQLKSVEATLGSNLSSLLSVNADPSKLLGRIRHTIHATLDQLKRQHDVLGRMLYTVEINLPKHPTYLRCVEIRIVWEDPSRQRKSFRQMFILKETLKDQKHPPKRSGAFWNVPKIEPKK